MTRIFACIAATAFVLATLFLGAAALMHGALADTDFTGEPPAAYTATSRSWTWDGGDALHVSIPATVRLVPGSSPRITVQGPADALSRIAYGHGHLELVRHGFWNEANWDGDAVTVTITGVTLHSIALAGSGRIDMGTLNQDRLALAVAGSGDVQAKGRADTLSLDIAGSGKARLGALAARAAHIRIAGAGTVEADAKDFAEVSITGSGTVRFSGKPAKLQTRIAGSGRIEDGAGQPLAGRGGD